MARKGNNCSVVGCTNTSVKTQGIIFYSFPLAPHKQEQRRKWISAIKRVNPDGTPWQPTKYSRICSAHFIGNKKSEHPLEPNYVPTIFPTDHWVPSRKRIKNQSRQGDLGSKERSKAEHLFYTPLKKKNLEIVASNPINEATDDQEMQLDFLRVPQKWYEPDNQLQANLRVVGEATNFIKTTDRSCGSSVGLFEYVAVKSEPVDQDKKVLCS